MQTREKGGFMRDIKVLLTELEKALLNLQHQPPKSSSPSKNFGDHYYKACLDYYRAAIKSVKNHSENLLNLVGPIIQKRRSPKELQEHYEHLKWIDLDSFAPRLFHPQYTNSQYSMQGHTGCYELLQIIRQFYVRFLELMQQHKLIKKLLKEGWINQMYSILFTIDARIYFYQKNDLAAFPYQQHQTFYNDFSKFAKSLDNVETLSSAHLEQLDGFLDRYSTLPNKVFLFYGGLYETQEAGEQYRNSLEAFCEERDDKQSYGLQEQVISKVAEYPSAGSIIIAACDFALQKTRRKADAIAAIRKLTELRRPYTADMAFQKRENFYDEVFVWSDKIFNRIDALCHTLQNYRNSFSGGITLLNRDIKPVFRKWVQAMYCEVGKYHQIIMQYQNIKRKNIFSEESKEVDMWVLKCNLSETLLSEMLPQIDGHLQKYKKEFKPSLGKEKPSIAVSKALADFHDQAQQIDTFAKYCSVVDQEEQKQESKALAL